MAPRHLVVANLIYQHRSGFAIGLGAHSEVMIDDKG